jgi:hypothetical protein
MPASQGFASPTSGELRHGCGRTARWRAAGSSGASDGCCARRRSGGPARRSVAAFEVDSQQETLADKRAMTMKPNPRGPGAEGRN